MNAQKHIIDEQLLWNYFSGAITPDQKTVIESWIQESEENKKMAQDIEYIYFATDTLNIIKSVDSTSALKEVKEKINRKRDYKHSFIFQLQRIAAILIIPLLISTIYLATKKDPVEFIEIRTNPGMVATVDLPDGSKVWLNSHSYLKHPKQFTGDTRDVELEGEAYFSVKKYNPQNEMFRLLGTKRSFSQNETFFFRTPKHPLPCPFPLNFSLLIITKKFGNLAKNRYICIV